MRRCLPLLCLLWSCSHTKESARPEPTPSLADTSFGFVGVEPIIDDGSQAGLHIADNMVEHMDEIRDALPLLQEARVSIAMIIQAAKLNDPAQLEQVLDLAQAAEQRGLELRPVPVLSADDGYFPNATNVDVYRPVVHTLIARWKARGLKTRTLVVDMEPSRELVQALGKVRIAEALPRHQVHRDRYREAQAEYAALVEELHADGWKVAVTTQATLLADYADGDDDLRQYFNVVLDKVAWDQIDFQLYRSAFESLAPELDAYFVYDFAKKAREQFPQHEVGVGVGLTHPGPIYYDARTENQRALRADLEAAVAAGIARERITVYNLKGILHGPPVCHKVLPCIAQDYRYGDNDPRSWFIDAAHAPPPEKSVSTSTLWSEFRLMDGLLNVSKDSQAR